MKPSDLERLAACLGEIKADYIAERRPFAEIARIDRAYRLSEKALNNHRRGLNYLSYGEETRYTREKVREMRRDFDDLGPEAA